MTDTAAPAKPARSLSWNAEGKFFLIQQGGKTSGYWLKELTHDLGPAARCFSVTKFAADRTAGDQPYYDVVISPAGDDCDCRGHLRYGWKTACRHVAAVRCLIAKGKLS